MATNDGGTDMKEYQNDELGLRFTLPERPTVRQQLNYRAAIALSPLRPDVYDRFWQGAKKLIGDWACEAIPDPEQFDMDTATDPRAADIIFYVCNAVAAHMDSLETVPGNS
jgi:hypothetical protein